MKKKKNKSKGKGIIISIVLIVLLAVIAVVAYLFLNKKAEDYLNVIPANATFVAAVDVKTIAEEGRLEKSSVMKSLDSYVGAVALGKDKKVLKDYMKEPSKMGIDFRSPVYVFKTAGEALGVTMKVADKGTMEEFISCLVKQNLATKATEKDGVMCGTLLEDIAYTYNNSTLLLFASLEKMSASKNKQMSVELMKLEAGDSFCSTKAFDTMNEQSGKDVVIYSNLSALPQSFAKQATTFIPNDVNNSDIEVVASVDFDKGRAVLTSSVWGKTDKAQDIIDDADRNMKKIGGRYIDMPTENTLVWIGMGAKGEWLLKKMKESKKTKEVLFVVERAIDIEQMISAVDGDVAVAVPASAIQNSVISSVANKFKKDDTIGFDFYAQAELDNDNFLSDVKDWQKSMKDYGMKMKETGDNEYRLELDGKDVNWGVTDGENLYIATSRAFKKNGKAEKSGLLKEYERDIKDSKMFAIVNLKSIPVKTITFFSGIPEIGKKLSIFKAVIFKAPSADKMEIVIELDDKDENFLKQVL